MRALILILFFLATIFLTIGYMNSQMKCPPPKIQYRFIPQNIYDTQFEEQNISNLFTNLFTQNPQK